MVSVINTIDTGHEDMIHDAKMDYCGVRLATCSSDHSVKVYDVRNGTQTLVADLKGHDGPVWQVSWAHPKFGNLLASCSYDRKVIIWKDTTGNNKWAKLHEYSNHESSVNSVCWAPHEFGLMLCCGSSDGSVSIISNSGSGHWDAKKIVNAHTIGCNSVSWCPATVPNSVFDHSATNNKPLKRIVTGGCDNLVKIWREEGDMWVEEAKLERHSDWVRDVAWAPSIGLPKSYIASGSQDRRVIIWSKDQTETWRHTVLHTFEDVIWNISWSLTGNILAVSGGDNKVTLWRRDTASDEQWTCISEVNKGQGQLVGSEQRAL